MKSQTLFSCMLGLTLFALFGTAHGDVELSFGVYTSNKPTAMVRKFRPVLNALEERLGEELNEPVTIRIQVAKDYSQGVAHLASGKVDFSRFGPASYVEAKNTNPDLRILAMERENGAKVFYGIICVSEDSPIQSVEELKGRNFAFGSEKSTIGRYLSQLHLREHGVFARDLGRFDYLGRHDKVGRAVGAGDYDAGALNESTYRKLIDKGVPIRELARFPNVTKPWIARAGLPDRLFKALQNVLLRMDDPTALAALKKDGFVMGDDKDFEQIREAIEANFAFFRSDEEGSASIMTASNREAGDLEPSAAMHTDASTKPSNNGESVGTQNGHVSDFDERGMYIEPTSEPNELVGDDQTLFDVVTDDDAGLESQGIDSFNSLEADLLQGSDEPGAADDSDTESKLTGWPNS